MHAWLTACWLCLPAYPLNPVWQDTMASSNLHVTVGLSGPNNLVGSGPELTGKYELRVVHPVVVRAAFDYRFGKVTSRTFPRGHLHSLAASMDVLYYRGTRKLTGYMGVGVMRTFHQYKLSQAAADSLLRYHQVREVGFRPTVGFRITMGLRFQRDVSLEIGVSEARPKLQFIRWLDGATYTVKAHRVRLSDARITLGYLWPLRFF
ncbi:MAG TPA: hypothetical protein VN285_08480 [Candidatus Deferrimicrobium sp.]|nr:hypothetical protein [Candidatus Deferrimicrobium sp.]